MKEYYEKYNFPAIQKLYQLLKENGHDIKKKDIENFLLKQKEHEMLKVKQVKKKQLGHITAFTYKQNAQMDIFDLSKYSKANDNYKYLVAFLDVFPRKVFVRPLKKKNVDDVLINIIDIFKDYTPHVITSDSDLTFMSNKIQELFNKYDIYHDVIIARDDHRALGIIDRFALNIKTVLSKLFIRNNNTNWINNIDDLVDNYNNTPHSGIENLTPNEATLEKYQSDLGMINGYKSKKIKIKSAFSEGDRVRIKINDIFKKGSEPRYSNKIYIVESVNGKRITLNNDKTYLESNLIKTLIENTDGNIINDTNRENSAIRNLQKEGLNMDNVLVEKRKTK
jgi:ribosomal protein L21E